MNHFKLHPFLLGSLILWCTSAPCQDHIVIQKNKTFSIEELKVNLEDSIIFKNDESNVTHNVYSITPGNEFELKTQKPGTSLPMLISKKKGYHSGEMLVECAIHPGMKLKVVIK
ncbi:MAG: hypothetical protein ABIQ95_16100 [Bdellovibrionia bacterium]